MRVLPALFALLLLAACTSTTVPQRAYVPWLPLPRANQYAMLPSPSPPVPIRPGTPQCRAAQLAGRLLGVVTSDTPVVFRNTGPKACVVNGTPELMIMDAQGVVLASSNGESGTQFDEYITEVDVLMLPGTPVLAEEPPTSESSILPTGQAFMHIKWSGCAQSYAASLVVDLPNATGSVTVAFAVPAPDLDTCPGQTPLVRDPLKPTGVAWPPAPAYIPVTVQLSELPHSAARGAALRYFVTVSATGNQDYVLSPCPDYAEALVNTFERDYQLNCGPAGVVRAGRSVTFEMKFTIPGTTPAGPSTFVWGLIDGRIGRGSVVVPITIT